MSSTDSSKVRPIITKEANSQRKAHRVNLPLFVDYKGVSYKALDWSVSGIGFRIFSDHVKKGDQIEVKLTLPMPDSSMQINMQMVCQHRTETHFGFEFVETNDRQRRILRHYVEMAVEGRLENVDDLVAISTMPVLNSPLEEALAFSEADQHAVDKAFKSHSGKIFATAAVFLVFIAASIFYTKVYKLETVGIVTGAVATIEAPIVGRVSEVYVQNNDYVLAGQPLFKIDNVELNAKIRALESKIATHRLGLTQQFDSNAYQPATHANELAVMAANSLKKQRLRDVERGRMLHKQRLINNKDLSYLENQALQATLAYEREIEKMRKALFNDQQRDVFTDSSASGLAKLSELEAELAIKQQQLAENVVYAETTGRLENFTLAMGDKINADELLANIREDIAPVISIQVDTDQALKLHVGMEAKVYSKLLGKHFIGYVSEIGHQAFDSNISKHVELNSPNTLVKIELSDPNIRLPENSRLKVWLKQFAV